VAPSLTATPMATRAAADPHILEYAARKQPLAGPMLDPQDVAMAALYFLSDESRAVTGQALAVDGGWSLVSTSAEPTR
jgi:NAD(P)-dependent dehydrogenase (short-subunit alcohol dehydrogenase family)